ncbi:tetratricopeptide repeat protein 27 isoform X2 [Lycorma delicatula]|uniref:tetratricopeptide repeat protein 27 isoform X2 n=1 Tax=Lycorma delicatula TaxID=130591 RepID=UPI003F512705
MIFCESKLIEGTSNSDGNTTDYRCVNDLLSGKLNEILKGPLVLEIFHQKSRRKLEDDTVEKLLQECMNEYVSANISAEKQLEILCFGIANLLLFIQSNWTGPPVYSLDFVIPWLAQWYQTDEDVLSRDEFSSAILQCLVLDGEGLTSTAKHLELLLLSRVVFNSELSQLASRKWWLLRCLQVHQQILDEPSQLLYSQIFQLATDLIDYEPLTTNNDVLCGALHLELAQAYLQYSQVSKSEQEIKTALKLLKMEINLTGALGKRTRYQEKDLAQLTINVSTERSSGTSSTTAVDVCRVKDLPKNVLLEDEVCLDGINFTDPNSTQFPNLTAVEQAAILALFVHTQKSHPKDNLQKEELSPYLNCVISQPKVWSIHASALLFRSRLELNNSRTIDRSLKQSEVLVECFNSDNPPVHYRLEYIFCSHLPPRWKVEADFASILITLGAVQSALDVYLRLQMWDEVIACYNFLKLRHKAAEIIRQEMQKKETVKLWCMLGDATDDIECYKKAWELSDKKSAKSQRHWGNYYFNRKQYGESIAYFEKSLSINSLQVDLWFRLGFAALDTEKWELSAKAYHRYCSLEPESFEAWNNLAKAYIKQGQKARAYHALKEAVKCNFENWKVWDNLMAVSTDCADFEQVVTSYHRILDLKGKHADEEVLKIVVEAIENDIKDCHGVPSKEHRKMVLTLFGRITSEVQNNAFIWQLYSRLLNTDENQNGTTQLKIAQCLQHAHKAATQGRWFSTVESSLKVLKLCGSLGDAYLICSKNCSLPQEKLNLLSSAKFSLTGVTTTIKFRRRL